MPKFKVGFPYIVVEAPDELAARWYYHGRAMGSWGFSDISAEVVDEDSDYAVDAEGYEIEEKEEGHA